MTLPYGVISDPHYHKWDSFSTTDADGLNSRLADNMDEAKSRIEDMMRELAHRHDLNDQPHKMQQVSH